MTERDYDPATDGRDGYLEAIRLIRERGLREGRFQPINEHEQRIAEGRHG